MKLLCFSDLHADLEAAQTIVQRAEVDNIDVVVGGGDFGNMHRDVFSCIDVLRQITKPVVLVPGNNESLEELKDACAGWESVTVLHGTGMTIAEVPFFGIGGGIPVTPFGPQSYDFTEEQAKDSLADLPVGAVLISHSPPNGVLDANSAGKHFGSVAVREAVLRQKPRLVVCGHIHASGGRTSDLHGIPVVNAGPGGIIVHL